MESALSKGEIRKEKDNSSMTKKKEWNRRFNGIGLKLEPQVVRIANDFVLDVYLQTDKRNCMRLAKYIGIAYREQFGEELQISARSLAIEIHSHYRVQKTAMKVTEHVGKTKMSDWLIHHTLVIDCGSLEKDSNRIIWDTLEKMWVLEQKTHLSKLRDLGRR